MATWRMMAVVLVALGMGVGACSFDPQSGEYRPDEDTGWDLEDPGDADSENDTQGGDPSDTDADAPDGDPVPADADSPDSEVPDADSPDADSPDAEVPDVDSPDTAEPGTEICNGQEVNLGNDPDHCGSCGNACDGEFGVCNNGQCGCTGTMEACGSGNACQEVLRDADNCGGCGEVCPAGASCNLGQCTCRPGYTLCGGECVDLETDARHCGSCDASCGLGHCKEGACGTGGCGFGWIECTQGEGLSCLPGFRQVDPLYCGPRPFQGSPCGEVCEASEVCALGLGGAECRGVRPARGCLNCPCEDCGDGERCRDDIESLSPGAYCVTG
ncbi:hypothetical protein EA187_07775 [Lujinxingia sediminis]|uniref:Tryptophan synthase alpha chain n=1 Tax=Lujinxingia sediminis TaxID=2480984 RepID=A0ABY0CVB6_9DELT|nr:hypothetical protein [Lujinxingia sediminis]RVU47021.1 hypothetical protein EA187_07775 [Lujinxingia sediminis]